MRITKEQNGITLVALIITIVVLLILAVVAIGAVRESGIIVHTQNAATDYNMAQANEDSAIQGYDSLINKYANPAIPAEELYWYEENEDGGITILGPKKVYALDEAKMIDKMTGIIDSEFGEGMLSAWMNETIVDEELIEQIGDKISIETLKIQCNNKEYDCFITRDISRQEVGTQNFLGSRGLKCVRLYNTEKLPEYISGRPVTQIGDYAFENICFFNGEFISNTVKVIGKNAFYGSIFKSPLIIPDSVEVIKDRAFRRMGSFFILDENEENFGSEVEIQLIMNDSKNKLKSIGVAAFQDNTFLTGTLTLRSEIEIDDSAFSNTNVIVNRK